MKALARLVWTYFAATLLTRALAGIGLASVIAGWIAYGYRPSWLTGADAERTAVAADTLLLSLPWIGVTLLVASSALMPKMVERMLSGRSIWLLPGARVRLLLSTVLPAAFLALVTAIAAAVAFLDFARQFPTVVEQSTNPLISMAANGLWSAWQIFWRTGLMAFVDYGLIYSAIWLVGKTSGVWRLAGLFWGLVCIMIPARYFGGLPPFSPLEGLGLAAWIAFAGIVLAGGRVRHWWHGIRPLLPLPGAGSARGTPYAAGNETALLLGTSRPWIVAVAQIVPITAMAWWIPDTRIWLLFLMLFASIAGAITSQAAGRSRRLWLRSDRSREELFPEVERTFWRYNLWFVAVLLLMLAALGWYHEFPQQTLALGAALIVVGCAVFTYLGFAITRQLGWFEAALCILTMVGQTIAAIAIMEYQEVVAREVLGLLFVLVFVYRWLAKNRWQDLDWMRARPAFGLRGA